MTVLLVLDYQTTYYNRNQIEYSLFSILTSHPYDFTLKNFPGLHHFIDVAENLGCKT